MPKTVGRRAKKFTVEDYFSADADLPEKLELVDGVIGPFSDSAKRALLANWGAENHRLDWPRDLARGACGVA